MSKIVIDARESGTTTGRYIDKLIEHMDKLEPQHQIIVLTHAERTEFFANASPNFVILQTPFKEFTFSEQAGFLRQLRDLKADLVHFGMVQQPVMYHGSTITTMHDLTTARFTNPDKNPTVFKLKQLVYKWVNKTAARKSAAIITPTQFVKDDVARFAGINPEKITVTYEAADFITDTPEAVPGLEGKQFIMYLGRPTPHKNLGRLIDAFKELQGTHPDLHLVLAGKKDANYRRHEARVAAEQIANITFTDFISEGQLRWLYQNCAAYIFPSLSEGFGLPGLEAMVHGAPVVSSNATCLPEVYGDAARYFNPLDVSDIAAQIAAVIDNEDIRAKLIKKGAEQAKKYSWDRMARQTLDLYQSVLDNANL